MQEGHGHALTFLILCSRWLEDRRHRCFDIMALFYANDTSWTCPDCIAIMRFMTTKWHALNTLYNLSYWGQIKDKYEAFMLTDDDVLMSTYSE